MIDVDATLAAIRTALETYNALPEQHVCGTCPTHVPGRLSPIACACDDCDATAPVNAAALEYDHRTKVWRVRVTQDTNSFWRRPDGSGYECRACVDARRDRESAAATAKAKAAATAKE